MASYTIKQTVVENLNADLDEKQPAGDYPTNASLAEALYKNTTNCITEIPQGIKLEISSDKRAVIKAGSKLYYPNGFEADGVTKKFDTYILPNDIQSVIYGAGRQVMCVITKNAGRFEWSATNVFFSGETQPTTNLYVWYDTKNNVIKFYDGISSPQRNDTCYLPLGLITENPESASGLHDGGLKSIDQVFNGFGYIGSTIFALPGMRAIAPNGRNSNGTLNNTQITITDVLTKTFGSDTYGEFDLCLNNLGYLDHFGHGTLHLTKDNLFENNGIVFANRTKICTFRVNSASDNGKITWLKMRQPFKSVDYSDGTFLSAQSMPSHKYIDLTLGASDSTYIAPANGWFILNKESTAANQELRLTNKANNMRGYIVTNRAAALSAVVPCLKGDEVFIFYSADGKTNTFRFIYAEGEQ